MKALSRMRDSGGRHEILQRKIGLPVGTPVRSQPKERSCYG
jgi:hypothetical protein